MSLAGGRLGSLRRLLAAEEYTEKFNTSFECCCCPLESNYNCSHVLITFSNYLEVLHVYYIPIIIAVGFIGNLLSCLVLLTTHLKLRSSSYYLAALALADTGYLLCTFIVYCSSKGLFNLYHMQGFCQFFVYLTYVCAFLSVWLIVAFTVERFIAVQYPLRRPYICTVSRAKTIVFSLTGVAIVCYLYVFWIAGIVNDECQLLPDYKNFAKVLNSVDTIITLVVPVVLIVGMNAMIARSLFRFRKKLQFEGVLDELFTSEKTELYSNSQSSASKKSKDHSQDLESTGSKRITIFKTLNDNEKYSHIHVKKPSKYAMSVQIQQNINKMLLVISSVFIALNFPSYLLRLCGYFEEMLEEYTIKNLGCAQMFAMLLYYTNFSINFLLYTMCDDQEMENVDKDTLQIPNDFDFPFPPYDIQFQFMQKLYFALENKKLGIFESPTGTGKSLSILCGAIRWLKDHNAFVRKKVNEKISKIELEKQEIKEESTNWLSSQSKEIKLNHMLNSLKIEQEKIKKYDEKIENLKTIKETKFCKKKYSNKEKDKEDKNNLMEESEKNIDDEDILLEECLPNHEESLSDEEEEERKFHPVKIYICSRTHSQLSQFVGEIIKSPFGKNVRVASLASRQTYCINPEVSRLKNMALINERCIDMQKKSKSQIKSDEEGKVTKKQKGSTCRCPYFKQTAVEELSNWALVEVQDVEDLVNSGKELNACPYYASRKAAEDAEIVLVPYNTILHKATREANGIQLKDNIVIIDEAHNLLEALAQMHNSDLSYSQLYHTLHQLKRYKTRYNTRFSAQNLLTINQLIFVVSKLWQMLDKNNIINSTEIYTIENFVLTAQIDNYNMFKLIKFCKESRIAQKIRSFAIKYSSEEEITEKPAKKGVKDFLSSIENKKINNKASDAKVETKNDTKPTVPPVSNPLLGVISFLESLTYSYEDGRILFVKNADKLQRKLQFLLLNPSSNFSDLINEARSVIVAGGTMKPISEFRDRLFVNSGAPIERIIEFSCDHIIPPENILPIIVTKGPKRENLLFNFDNRLSMGHNLKGIIQQACKAIKGGIVVFFPSYKYENWVWQQMKDLTFGRPVFREPQTSGAVDSVLEKYAAAIKRPSSSGALLFSVVGGKLSEGLNFSDDLGRCVIVVGLPYANIMAADLKEKMAYLDKTEGFGSGKKFYENLCMKAVNQCIGRAVRHKNDYATVLLLDERYNRASIKNALPDWIKRSLKVCDYEETFDNLQKFFEEKKTV